MSKHNYDMEESPKAGGHDACTESDHHQSDAKDRLRRLE
jgi:hypothetical protein